MLPAHAQNWLTHKVVFTNFSGKDEHKGKAKLLIEYLSRHSLIAAYIDSKDVCRISLVGTANPACVYFDPADTINIELSTWYFENRSIGYIMGMLCHEFGVHPIPSEIFDTSDEDIPEQRKIDGGLSGSNKKFLTWGAADQRDHIFASVPIFTRYSVYLDVVTRMAALLVNDNTGATKGAAVADLIDCYLMDIASILGTNDHRAKGLTSAGEIAAYYNHHLARALEHVHAAGINPQLTQSLGEKDTFSIIKDYGGVLADFISGKVTGGSSKQSASS